MLKYICYPKCSTCQKGEKFLKENELSYTIRDIKLDNPNVAEIKALWAKSGLPLKRFFNTSGLIYRDLGLKDKLPTMTEAEQLALLATDGMLVKRPILEGENFVLVGFKEKEWTEKLK